MINAFYFLPVNDQPVEFHLYSFVHGIFPKGNVCTSLNVFAYKDYFIMAYRQTIPEALPEYKKKSLY